jgi:endonuclease/exonuclease/phosphatase family metal-dependent hydrolase
MRASDALVDHRGKEREGGRTMTNRPLTALFRHVFALALLWSGSSDIASSQEANSLRIMTWNIANLHHETGIPLRPGAIAREDIDYDRIASTISALNADIIAFQEIGSLQALMRVISTNDYHLAISDRYKVGDEQKSAKDRDIYTAVAVSKSKFPLLPQIHTINAFSLTHFDFDRDENPSQRPTRSAIEIRFNWEDKEISLLNLHLKSSCHQYPLTVVEDQNFFTGDAFGSRYDCRTLKAQLAILENWTEFQVQARRYPILAGDFNRRLNMLYRNPTRFEDFWHELNDGQPNNLELVKGPLGLDKICWPQNEHRFEDHIDFIVADRRLVPSEKLPVYQKFGLGFDDAPEYKDDQRQRISDHCPVMMELYSY